MTKDEFLNKYAGVLVTFSHYYKYTFTFKAVLPDGTRLSVGYGGNHDEIYRYELVNNEQIKIGALDPYTGSVYKDNGEEIESFYDY